MEKSQSMTQLMVLVIANPRPLISMTHRPLPLVMMLDRMILLDSTTASQLIEREMIVKRDVTTSVQITSPVPQIDGSRSVINTNVDVTASEAMTVANLDGRKGSEIAMIDTVAVTTGNNIEVVTRRKVVRETRVVTGIEIGDRRTNATGTTIAAKIPIPVPGAQREVGRGRREIQSHAQVETSLLSVDIEVEIGKLFSQY